MVNQSELSDQEIRGRIRKGTIGLAGNKSLKIYGHLSCHSGKRMKKENRVYFISKGEAKKNGFRPCGHCMKNEFKQWNYSVKTQ
ncbi:MAG: metal-binding protein [Cyclobacteriaceae bacterium]|nr:metal-binding protein [Cyclobacteriaceae bacterium]